MKIEKKKLLSVILCTTMAFAMTGLSGIMSNADERNVYVPTITSAPSKAEVVNLLKGDILEYASNYQLYKSANYLPEGYPTGYGSSADTKKRPDDFAPASVTLSWESEDGVQYYTVKVATTKDFSDAMSYVTLDTSLELFDLFAGKTYYYQIVAKFADKAVKSQVFSFKTANLIRTIELEGVSNTRDAGGYYTVDGNRIRQGLVYRGGKLEDITPAAKEKALNYYGFKTDLDLRAEKSVSPLGDSVNFVNVSGPYYVTGSSANTLVASGTGINSTQDSSRGTWNGTYRDALLKEIKTFANPENYPIYVHCSLGRDRTGTIIFLINALCGVGEMDLYMDYEASFFSTVGCLDAQTPQNIVGGAFAGLMNAMKKYGSGSLAENVEKFMLDLGVTQAEIDTIRSIMIEEVK